MEIANSYLNRGVFRIEHYYSSFETPQKGAVVGNGKATLHRVEFESKGKRGVERINYLDDLVIHLYITVDPEIRDFTVGIAFLSLEQQLAAQCSSVTNKKRLHNAGDLMHIAVKLTSVNLNPSVYSLIVGINDESTVQVLSNNHSVKELQICGDFVGYAPVQFRGEWELNKA